MSDTRLLVVDDEAIVRNSLGAWLRAEGFGVDAVAGGREALDMARVHPYAAVLLDIRMPGMDGLETLRELRHLVPELPVVMMTAYADVSTAVAAMKAGAEEYVTKPFDPDELSTVIRRLVQRQAQPGKLPGSRGPAGTAWSLDDFVGSSPTMATVMDLARRAAEADVTVLLRGERGLGKECLARAIHGASRRRIGPFVPVHCGGLSEAVMEAELFGYEQGVLPGSPLAKKGRLELADLGILYLDEVTSLSERLQVALLDALEDRMVARLGGHTRNGIDIRPISATSQDPDALVKGGAFLLELLASTCALSRSPVGGSCDGVQVVE